ncbi:uncharacterized protein LOC110172029 isoform X2 [Boleophthalmus pectinirostris]|uniref:uncharacterized protein LOC110172029 isoform X2 n=1 Tax=Boleophthalmus pectinirostris TaxID=150288 RepID=UPI00242F1F26|nr:uncharacterized protein LOC110172029 isoform X2 [Boleophthalmus pectinirostris]
MWKIFSSFFGGNKDQPSEVSVPGDKYHGLQNQGATCYLNSVLQVLHMTEDFKERVTSHTRNNPETGYIDKELSDLFLELEGKAACPVNITNKLRINNVNVQHDAAELYEKILRLTSPEASQIFRGKLINKNTCRKCHAQIETETGFWHLPLPLGNGDDYSVERGILDFFRPSEISGDNQMYCETCDEKCDAVLECKMLHPPEVLVLLIKRFEFDLTLGKYLQSFVDVPLVVNIQNQIYELHALVEHFGEPGSGRYLATIKGHDGRWYMFEDLHVTVSRNQYFQSCLTERSQTAYLLFYQKQKGVLFLHRHVMNNPGTEHIDRELSDLFSELEEHWTYTYNITKKLKINNVFEQRDAAEHYEKILRLTSPEASQIFHGELTNRVKCHYCKEETKSTTGFWHVPLSLLDSDCSVHRSLQDFIQREVQMYCVNCDETRDVSLHCELEHHPEVLVLLMKRFEYDRQMRYVKNTCVVEVPHTLHMPLPYELYACVEHYGELRFGHYIARIKSNDKREWYIFDDLSVIPNIFQEHPTMRSQEAYLLFYQRQKDSFPVDVKPDSTPETPQDKDEEQNTNNNQQNKGNEENFCCAMVRPEMKEDHELTPNILKPEKWRIQENTQNKERRDEHELHCEISDSEEICQPDLDQLADSFSKMTLTDRKDSLLQQVDNNRGNQSLIVCNCEMREEEMRSDKNFESLMDHGGDLIDSSFESSPCEMPADLMDYKLKFTLRLKDRESHEKTIDGDSLQAKVTTERSEENCQPYHVHYPDNEEDKRRTEATKRFIRNEEQEGLRPPVPQNKERSEQRKLRRDKLTKEGSRKYDGVEKLGVVEEGDTETIRLKPKKRQDTDELKAEQEQNESVLSDSKTGRMTLV